LFIVEKYNILIEKLKAKQMNLTSSTLVDETSPLSEEQEADINLPPIMSITSIPLIKARVFNYRPVTKIKPLKSNIYNQFVSVVGTVTRVSASKHFVTRLAFECDKCHTTFVNELFFAG